jgi:hypothetical protein
LACGWRLAAPFFVLVIPAKAGIQLLSSAVIPAQAGIHGELVFSFVS